MGHAYLIDIRKAHGEPDIHFMRILSDCIYFISKVPLRLGDREQDLFGECELIFHTVNSCLIFSLQPVFSSAQRAAVRSFCWLLPCCLYSSYQVFPLYYSILFCCKYSVCYVFSASSFSFSPKKNLSLNGVSITRTGLSWFMEYPLLAMSSLYSM